MERQEVARKNKRSGNNSNNGSSGGNVGGNHVSNEKVTGTGFNLNLSLVAPGAEGEGVSVKRDLDTSILETSRVHASGNKTPLRKPSVPPSPGKAKRNGTSFSNEDSSNISASTTLSLGSPVREGRERRSKNQDQEKTSLNSKNSWNVISTPSDKNLSITVPPSTLKPSSSGL